MARAFHNAFFAGQCHALLEKGPHWIDATLFIGGFYVQQVRGLKKEQIARNMVSDMGSDNGGQPGYQAGAGCLVDQLVGRYQSEVGGLGSLVKEAHLRKTLDSNCWYKYKRDVPFHARRQDAGLWQANFTEDLQVHAGETLAIA